MKINKWLSKSQDDDLTENDADPNSQFVIKGPNGVRYYSPRRQTDHPNDSYSSRPHSSRSKILTRYPLDEDDLKEAQKDYEVQTFTLDFNEEYESIRFKDKIMARTSSNQTPRTEARVFVNNLDMFIPSAYQENPIKSKIRVREVDTYQLVGDLNLKVKESTRNPHDSPINDHKTNIVKDSPRVVSFDSQPPPSIPKSSSPPPTVNGLLKFQKIKSKSAPSDNLQNELEKRLVDVNKIALEIDKEEEKLKNKEPELSAALISIDSSNNIHRFDPNLVHEKEVEEEIKIMVTPPPPSPSPPPPPAPPLPSVPLAPPMMPLRSKNNQFDKRESSHGSHSEVKFRTLFLYVTWAKYFSLYCAFKFDNSNFT